MKIERAQSYIKNAAIIIEQYDGAVPLSIFLKQYFAKNKKFGSTDRKLITQVIFSYFRMGAAFHGYSLQSKITNALFFLKDSLSENWKDFIKQQNPAGDLIIENIFPFKQYLSSAIEPHEFEKSFLLQPDVFLRIRPNSKKTVVEKLTKANCLFELEMDTIRLTNATPIEEILKVNEEVVIQDASSQQVAAFLLEAKRFLPESHPIKIYDCCAASGGKSILAYDVLHNIQLTVSDIRSSILANLKKRFDQAQISSYKSFIADLTHPKSLPVLSLQDLIIADVPCSGSGTWARTPEQIRFFKEEDIDKYALLQRNILNTVIPLIKPHGLLLYITCSVFKKENEEHVQNLATKGFQVIKQELIKGYNRKADTMFAALLQKLP